MKKYLLGICAIALAIAFSNFTVYTNNSKIKAKYENYSPTVRFFDAVSSTWSSTDEDILDAITSSGCPDGTAAVCATFYDINHLNFDQSGAVTSIKTDPLTGQPYLPDVTRKYN